MPLPAATQLQVMPSPAAGANLSLPLLAATGSPAGVGAIAQPAPVVPSLISSTSSLGGGVPLRSEAQEFRLQKLEVCAYEYHQYTVLIALSEY